MVTRSPVFIPFSNWIKMPVIMSLTRVCAPNEMASPNAPAPASSGAILTPISESKIITVMVLITTASALRNRVSSVRARALGSGRPWISEARRFSIRLANTVQPIAEKKRIRAIRISTSTVFCPASLCSHSRKSNSPQALRSSIMATQTVRMRAAFSEAEIQPFSRFCSSG
ncbi:hypothetical protein SB00610_05046 [Klebsiella quasipneumoniae subsp. similipneumoniae]|nr:hypothetical protein SB00610_05046 [Klebsiella quasipneumoniae subsp. similipneumoniae]